MITPTCVCVPAADILVYINDSCVLGRSHKEVVEMLKSVPMGQSVDVVLRRGYPMLYNPDGCPKQSLETVRRRLRRVTGGKPRDLVSFTNLVSNLPPTAADAQRTLRPPQSEPRPHTPHLQPPAGHQRQHARSLHAIHLIKNKHKTKSQSSLY